MSAINIQTLDVLEGDLPEKALNLVKEWIQQYQSEILEIWFTQQFKKVPPLV